MNDQLLFYKAKLEYEIDSWDLNDSLNRGEDVMVVDARSMEAFQSEHIPNAINLPHRSMSAENTLNLNKNTLYVTLQNIIYS